MADGAEEDDKLVREAKLLPLPERLAHASWKVRADAYADVAKEAGVAQNGSTPPLAEFGAPGSLGAAPLPPASLTVRAFWCQASSLLRSCRTATPTRWTPAWMR